MVPSQKPAAPVADQTTTPMTPLAPAPQLPPSSRPGSGSASRPTEDEIRAYANHLYLQRGSTDGHDCDDWLEAEACLEAGIPKENSHTRMHHHTQITERAAIPLVKHGRS